MNRGQQYRIWYWYLLLITDLSFVHGETLIITVPALGRVGRLGELYNSVTAECTQVSIMDQDVPEKFITRIGTPMTDGKHDLTLNANEKSAFIGVSSDLNLKANVGVFYANAGAALGFLGGGTKKEKTITGAFQFKTETDRDILEIFYDEMRPLISKEILQDSDDTHVIVGIGWGATVITQFEDQSSELEHQYGIKGKLRAGIGAAFSSGAIAKLFPNSSINQVPGVSQNGFGISAGAELAANASVALNESFAGLSWSLFGDVYFRDADYPSNITDVLEMIRQIPYMVDGSNYGRGKQMAYYLMPIDRVRAFVNFTKPARTGVPTGCSCNSDASADSDEMSLDSYPDSDPTTNQMRDGILEASMETLEQSEIVSNKLNDLTNYFEGHADIVNSTILRSLRQLRAEFKNVTDQFETGLRDAVIIAGREIVQRSAEPRGQTMMKNLITSYVNDTYGLVQMEDTIDHEFKAIKMKIKMVEMLGRNNITWVGRGDRVGTIFIQDLERDGELLNKSACALHYYSWYLVPSPLHFVKVALESRKKGRVYISDCDFPHFSCGLIKNRDYNCHTFYRPLPNNTAPTPPPNNTRTTVAAG